MPSINKSLTVKHFCITEACPALLSVVKANSKQTEANNYWKNISEAIGLPHDVRLADRDFGDLSDNPPLFTDLMR